MKDSRYEEALERAKELHEAGNSLTKAQMEIVFPELKESEDERIRKELIEEIEFIIPHDDETDSEGLMLPSYHARIDRYKSYLEKQKEQKPESCDCSRDEESYTNGIHHVLMNPEAYGLIKQKPAEQLGDTFTSYDIAKTFTEGQNYVIAHPEKFGLCKPAECSEEDETAFNDLMWCIQQARKSAKDENDMGNIWFAENWLKNRLKSLRPQLSGNFAISFMNYLDEHRPDGKMCLSNGECADIETAFKKEDWEKVIRYVNKYQPHWKPSEEQMKALEDAFRKDGGNEYRKVINSLYCDLQKLL